MKGSLYVMVYALVVGLVSSTILTAVGLFTAPYRLANAQAEEVRNVLEVLGVEVAEGASAQELLQLYQETVSEERRGELVLYRYDQVGEGGEKKPQAYAVRFGGAGLWGPIMGFLALEPDFRTIRGLSFYKQEETPGLGGEIVSEWFRKQFVGKSITDAQGQPGLRLVRAGTVKGVNEVDAITGATMTSGRVEVMLNDVIRSLTEETENPGQGAANE